MRIQHNIMAMNAYRNYTTNTSAMQKNLERLSSGYKINRAGDDAAGLAISEKMRAQITGLQVAQKNAKDGISLVQTAEGALTEVHDMLNRMVELATQSANGTYSNDTDRVQLQKEMDQLRSEIDRIADSANFNGIQLLDGNMDAGGDVVYTKGLFQFNDSTLHPTGVSDNRLPDVAKGEGTRGKDTILHSNGTKGGDTNAFSIDLENLSLNAKKSIAIEIGDNLTITVTNLKDEAMTADKIIAAIAANGDENLSVDFGEDVVVEKNEDGNLTVTIGEDSVFELTADGTRLTFTQTDGEDIRMAQKVTVRDAEVPEEPKPTPVSVDGDLDFNYTPVNNGADPASLTIDFSGITVDKAGDIDITIAGQKYTINISEEEFADQETKSIGELIAEKLEAAITETPLAADQQAGAITAVASGSVLTLTGTNSTDESTNGFKDYATDGSDITIEGTPIPGEPLEVTGYNEDNLIQQTADGVASISEAEITIDLTGLTVEEAGTITITIGENSYDIEITQDDIDNAETTPLDEFVASKLAELIQAGDVKDTAAGNYSVDATGTTGAKIVLKSATKAVATDTVPEMSITAVKAEEVEGPKGEYVKDTDKADEAVEGGTVEATSDAGTINWQSTGTDLTGLNSGTKTITVEIGDQTFEVKLVGDGETPPDEGEEGVDWVQMPDWQGTTQDNATELFDAIKEALIKQAERYNAEMEATGEDYVKIEITDVVGETTGEINVTYNSTPMKFVPEETEATSENFSGDWNTGTTVLQTKNAGTQDRLASTVIELTDDMVKEGSTITIGRDTYTFTTDKSKMGKDGYVVYNEGESLDVIAHKLTEAARNNKTYTVGHDDEGRITLLEREDQTNFDLTTKEGIEKSLGFKVATTRAVDTSKGLTLQIGDTAESYNQLKVNIKDCHVKALSLDQISIASQADAAEAVDAINEAINYVSDVRGTLGATQNRLDHTINNLSVMTENIQDAESTIRDTDIAEEMMSYTKNNILIQAAQAMLAQANQVPQGVLQLLQ